MRIVHHGFDQDTILDRLVLAKLRRRPKSATLSANMSQDLGTQETTSVRADFLVERRGFKLMVIVA
jgi:hypothetical protein